MERTEIPPRADTRHLRALVRRRREAGMITITLPVDDVDSLCIEAELFRNHYEASRRRQKDGARTRKPAPPKITLQNVDQYDEPR
jgi:hypothetical protein